MNRRLFLRGLMGGAAALTMDPERLLFVPGRNLISIPAAPRFVVGDVINNAYRELGLITPPMKMPAADLDFAVRELNSMIDRWGRAPNSHEFSAWIAPDYGLRMGWGWLGIRDGRIVVQPGQRRSA